MAHCIRASGKLNQIVYSRHRQSRSCFIPRCSLSAGGATLPPKNRLTSSGAVSALPFAGLFSAKLAAGTTVLTVTLAGQEQTGSFWSQPYQPTSWSSWKPEGQLQTFMVLLWLQSEVSFVCLCIETFNCLNFKLVSTFRSEANHLTKMREIVHVQAGQCGNQIGAKFWEIIRFVITSQSWIFYILI